MPQTGDSGNGRWESVGWDDLVTDDKMSIIRNFYKRYSDLIDWYVPFEKGLVTLIALESL